MALLLSIPKHILINSCLKIFAEDEFNDKSADEITQSMTLKYLIEQICKQAKWFVDEKLETLLQPYPELAKSNFVQIDNIFEV